MNLQDLDLKIKYPIFSKKMPSNKSAEVIISPYLSELFFSKASFTPDVFSWV